MDLYQKIQVNYGIYMKNQLNIGKNGYSLLDVFNETYNETKPDKAICQILVVVASRIETELTFKQKYRIDQIKKEFHWF